MIYIIGVQVENEFIFMSIHDLCKVHFASMMISVKSLE